MKRTIAAFLILAAFPATASAQELTVYSSLPLSGASRVSTKAINDGARQALQQAGGTAAGRPVRLVTLNDATRRTGAWTPERELANARRAAGDDASIAYIGPFNSGASRIAIPVLSEAGVPIVNPSNTYNGLTTSGPGTTRGEPMKYYPMNLRNYFRLLPNDHVQAAALATAMRDRGCKRIAVLNDHEVYGRGLAADVRVSARRLGLRIAVNERIDRKAGDYRSLARSIKAARADCFAFTGITANNAVQLFKDVGRALPDALLFGGEGIAESGFTREVPRSVGRRTTITVSTLGPEAYGLPAGTDPYRALGFEAMRLLLDGLNAAGPTRAGLLGWLPTVQNRPSALGTYSFDANGDTTLRTYGLYTVRNRALRYAGPITAG